MTDLSQLRFFVTPEHDCSYLDGQQATTLFLDPAVNISAELNGQLSALGFRRSGNHLYRPQCRQCNACIPARVPVDLYRPGRTQQRIRRRNTDLQLSIGAARLDDEVFALYERYILQRHADGDMYPPSRSQFEDFLLHDLPFTRFHEFRLDGRLVAVAVTDHLPNGLSAVYTFYEPELPQRSLGRFAIQHQIAHCRELGLPHLYLGYWIRECQKMSYKGEYRPLEVLIRQKWVRI
ncbi:MAG: arginyltransferase [Halopseudomonas yangmingensis]